MTRRVTSRTVQARGHVRVGRAEERALADAELGMDEARRAVRLNVVPGVRKTLREMLTSAGYSPEDIEGRFLAKFDAQVARARRERS